MNSGCIMNLFVNKSYLLRVRVISKTLYGLPFNNCHQGYATSLTGIQFNWEEHFRPMHFTMLSENKIVLVFICIWNCVTRLVVRCKHLHVATWPNGLCVYKLGGDTQSFCKIFFCFCWKKCSTMKMKQKICSRCQLTRLYKVKSDR